MENNLGRKDVQRDYWKSMFDKCQQQDASEGVCPCSSSNQHQVNGSEVSQNFSRSSSATYPSTCDCDSTPVRDNRTMSTSSSRASSKYTKTPRNIQQITHDVCSCGHSQHTNASIKDPTSDDQLQQPSSFSIDCSCIDVEEHPTKDSLPGRSYVESNKSDYICSCASKVMSETPVGQKSTRGGLTCPSHPQSMKSDNICSCSSRVISETAEDITAVQVACDCSSVSAQYKTPYEPDMSQPKEDSVRCVCSSANQKLNQPYGNMSNISMSDDDVVYIERIKALLDNEELLKKEVEDLSHVEKSFQERLHHKRCMGDTRAGGGGDYEKENLKRLNQKLEESNRQLESEIEKVANNLKRTKETLEAPMKQEIDMEKRKIADLESQLRNCSCDLEGRRLSGEQELVFLQNQLQTSTQQLSDLNLVNTRLKEELCLLNCRANELQTEIINQKLSEIHTLSRLSAQNKLSDLSGSKYRNVPASGGKKSDDLNAIARNLSKLLVEANDCNKCQNAHPDLIDTVQYIKNLVDLVNTAEPDERRSSGSGASYCECVDLDQLSDTREIYSPHKIRSSESAIGPEGDREGYGVYPEDTQPTKEGKYITPEGTEASKEVRKVSLQEAQMIEGELPDGEVLESKVPEEEVLPVKVPEGEIAEEKLPEGEVQEGEMPKGDVMEGEVLSGELPAGKVPEGEILEGGVPEEKLPEGELPEGEVPGGEVPGEEAPEEELLEGEVLEGKVPEEEVPEGEVLEVKSPEEEVPEGEIPEEKAVEEEVSELQDEQAQEGEVPEGEVPKETVPEGEKLEEKADSEVPKEASEEGVPGEELEGEGQEEKLPEDKVQEGEIPDGILPKKISGEEIPEGKLPESELPEAELQDDNVPGDIPERKLSAVPDGVVAEVEKDIPEREVPIGDVTEEKTLDKVPQDISTEKVEGEILREVLPQEISEGKISEAKVPKEDITDRQGTERADTDDLMKEVEKEEGMPRVPTEEGIEEGPRKDTVREAGITDTGPLEAGEQIKSSTEERPIEEPVMEGAVKDIPKELLTDEIPTTRPVTEDEIAEGLPEEGVKAIPKTLPAEPDLTEEPIPIAKDETGEVKQQAVKELGVPMGDQPESLELLEGVPKRASERGEDVPKDLDRKSVESEIVEKIPTKVPKICKCVSEHPPKPCACEIDPDRKKDDKPKSTDSGIPTDVLFEIDKGKFSKESSKAGIPSELSSTQARDATVPDVDREYKSDGQIHEPRESESERPASAPADYKSTELVSDAHPITSGGPDQEISADVLDTHPLGDGMISDVRPSKDRLPEDDKGSADDGVMDSGLETRQSKDGEYVTTAVTGAGILEVTTEGPAGIIETTLKVTDSGNIEVVTDVTEFEEAQAVDTEKFSEPVTDTAESDKENVEGDAEESRIDEQEDEDTTRDKTEIEDDGIKTSVLGEPGGDGVDSETRQQECLEGEMIPPICEMDEPGEHAEVEIQVEVKCISYEKESGTCEMQEKPTFKSKSCQCGPEEIERFCICSMPTTAGEIEQPEFAEKTMVEEEEEENKPGVETLQEFGEEDTTQIELGEERTTLGEDLQVDSEIKELIDQPDTGEGEELEEDTGELNKQIGDEQEESSKADDTFKEGEEAGILEEEIPDFVDKEQEEVSEEGEAMLGEDTEEDETILEEGEEVILEEGEEVILEEGEEVILEEGEEVILEEGEEVIDQEGEEIIFEEEEEVILEEGEVILEDEEEVILEEYEQFEDTGDLRIGDGFESEVEVEDQQICVCDAALETKDISKVPSTDSKAVGDRENIQLGTAVELITCTSDTCQTGKVIAGGESVCDCTSKINKVCKECMTEPQVNICTPEICTIAEPIEEVEWICECKDNIRRSICKECSKKPQVKICTPDICHTTLPIEDVEWVCECRQNRNKSVCKECSLDLPRKQYDRKDKLLLDAGTTCNTKSGKNVNKSKYRDSDSDSSNERPRKSQHRQEICICQRSSDNLQFKTEYSDTSFVEKKYRSTSRGICTVPCTSKRTQQNLDECTPTCRLQKSQETNTPKAQYQKYIPDNRKQFRGHEINQRTTHPIGGRVPRTDATNTPQPCIRIPCARRHPEIKDRGLCCYSENGSLPNQANMLSSENTSTCECPSDSNNAIYNNVNPSNVNPRNNGRNNSDSTSTCDCSSEKSNSPKNKVRRDAAEGSCVCSSERSTKSNSSKEFRNKDIISCICSAERIASQKNKIAQNSSDSTSCHCSTDRTLPKDNIKNIYTVSCRCTAGNETLQNDVKHENVPRNKKLGDSTDTISCVCPSDRAASLNNTVEKEILDTTSCSCPSEKSTSPKNKRRRESIDTVSCVCPYEKAASSNKVKQDASDTISCRCPSEMSASLKNRRRRQSIDTVSCVCPSEKADSSINKVEQEALDTMSCRCPSERSTSSKSRRRRESIDTVSCVCPSEKAASSNKNDEQDTLDAMSCRCPSERSTSPKNRRRRQSIDTVSCVCPSEKAASSKNKVEQETLETMSCRCPSERSTSPKSRRRRESIDTVSCVCPSERAVSLNMNQDTTHNLSCNCSSERSNSPDSKRCQESIDTVSCACASERATPISNQVVPKTSDMMTCHCSSETPVPENNINRKESIASVSCACPSERTPSPDNHLEPNTSDTMPCTCPSEIPIPSNKEKRRKSTDTILCACTSCLCPSERSTLPIKLGRRKSTDTVSCACPSERGTSPKYKLREDGSEDMPCICPSEASISPTNTKQRSSTDTASCICPSEQAALQNKSDNTSCICPSEGPTSSTSKEKQSSEDIRSCVCPSVGPTTAKYIVPPKTTQILSCLCISRPPSPEFKSALSTCCENYLYPDTESILSNEEEMQCTCNTNSNNVCELHNCPVDMQSKSTLHSFDASYRSCQCSPIEAYLNSFHNGSRTDSTRSSILSPSLRTTSTCESVCVKFNNCNSETCSQRAVSDDRFSISTKDMISIPEDTVLATAYSDEHSAGTWRGQESQRTNSKIAEGTPQDLYPCTSNTCEYSTISSISSCSPVTCKELPYYTSKYDRNDSVVPNKHAVDKLSKDSASKNTDDSTRADWLSKNIPEKRSSQMSPTSQNLPNYQTTGGDQKDISSGQMFTDHSKPERRSTSSYQSNNTGEKQISNGPQSRDVPVPRDRNGSQHSEVPYNAKNPPDSMQQPISQYPASPQYQQTVQYPGAVSYPGDPEYTAVSQYPVTLQHPDTTRYSATHEYAAAARYSHPPQHQVASSYQPGSSTCEEDPQAQDIVESHGTLQYPLLGSGPVDTLHQDTSRPLAPQLPGSHVGDTIDSIGPPHSDHLSQERVDRSSVTSSVSPSSPEAAHHKRSSNEPASIGEIHVSYLPSQEPKDQDFQLPQEVHMSSAPAQILSPDTHSDVIAEPHKKDQPPSCSPKCAGVPQYPERQQTSRDPSTKHTPNKVSAENDKSNLQQRSNSVLSSPISSALKQMPNKKPASVDSLSTGKVEEPIHKKSKEVDSHTSKASKLGSKESLSLRKVEEPIHKKPKEVDSHTSKASKLGSKESLYDPGKEPPKKIGSNVKPLGTKDSTDNQVGRPNKPHISSKQGSEESLCEPCGKSPRKTASNVKPVGPKDSSDRRIGRPNKPPTTESTSSETTVDQVEQGDKNVSHPSRKDKVPHKDSSIESSSKDPSFRQHSKTKDKDISDNFADETEASPRIGKTTSPRSQKRPDRTETSSKNDISRPVKSENEVDSYSKDPSFRQHSKAKDKDISDNSADETEASPRIGKTASPRSQKRPDRTETSSKNDISRPVKGENEVDSYSKDPSFKQHSNAKDKDISDNSADETEVSPRIGKTTSPRSQKRPDRTGTSSKNDISRPVTSENKVDSYNANEKDGIERSPKDATKVTSPKAGQRSTSNQSFTRRPVRPEITSNDPVSDEISKPVYSKKDVASYNANENDSVQSSREGASKVASAKTGPRSTSHQGIDSHNSSVDVEKEIHPYTTDKRRIKDGSGSREQLSKQLGDGERNDDHVGTRSPSITSKRSSVDQSAKRRKATKTITDKDDQPTSAHSDTNSRHAIDQSLSPEHDSRYEGGEVPLQTSTKDEDLPIAAGDKSSQSQLSKVLLGSKSKIPVAQTGTHPPGCLCKKCNVDFCSCHNLSILLPHSPDCRCVKCVKANCNCGDPITNLAAQAGGEHPPNCDCVDCLCDPSRFSKLSINDERHPPDCDCLQCLCEADDDNEVPWLDTNFVSHPAGCDCVDCICKPCDDKLREQQKAFECPKLMYTVQKHHPSCACPMCICKECLHVPDCQCIECKCRRCADEKVMITQIQCTCPKCICDPCDVGVKEAKLTDHGAHCTCPDCVCAPCEDARVEKQKEPMEQTNKQAEHDPTCGCYFCMCDACADPKIRAVTNPPSIFSTLIQTNLTKYDASNSTPILSKPNAKELINTGTESQPAPDHKKECTCDKCICNPCGDRIFHTTRAKLKMKQRGEPVNLHGPKCQCPQCACDPCEMSSYSEPKHGPNCKCPRCICDPCNMLPKKHVESQKHGPSCTCPRCVCDPCDMTANPQSKPTNHEPKCTCSRCICDPCEMQSNIYVESAKHGPDCTCSKCVCDPCVMIANAQAKPAIHGPDCNCPRCICDPCDMRPDTHVESNKIHGPDCSCSRCVCDPCDVTANTRQKATNHGSNCKCSSCICDPCDMRLDTHVESKQHDPDCTCSSCVYDPCDMTANLRSKATNRGSNCKCSRCICDPCDMRLDTHVKSKRHGPDCTCSSCVCDPCDMTANSRSKATNHGPDCKCPKCICDPCDLQPETYDKSPIHAPQCTCSRCECGPCDMGGNDQAKPTNHEPNCRCPKCICDPCDMDSGTRPKVDENIGDYKLSSSQQKHKLDCRCKKCRCEPCLEETHDLKFPKQTRHKLNCKCSQCICINSKPRSKPTNHGPNCKCLRCICDTCDMQPDIHMESKNHEPDCTCSSCVCDPCDVTANSRLKLTNHEPDCKCPSCICDPCDMQHDRHVESPKHGLDCTCSSCTCDPCKMQPDTHVGSKMHGVDCTCSTCVCDPCDMTTNLGSNPTDHGPDCRCSRCICDPCDMQPDTHVESKMHGVDCTCSKCECNPCDMGGNARAKPTNHEPDCRCPRCACDPCDMDEIKGAHKLSNTQLKHNLDCRCKKCRCEPCMEEPHALKIPKQSHHKSNCKCTQCICKKDRKSDKSDKTRKSKTSFKGQAAKQGDLPRQQEIEELECLIDQIRCACSDAEAQAARTMPFESGESRKASSSREKLGELTTALVTLQQKCTSQDRMIDAMAQELRFRPNCNVIDQSGQTLGATDYSLPPQMPDYSLQSYAIEKPRQSGVCFADACPMRVTEVSRISANSLLVKWSQPSNSHIIGYEVTIDDVIKSRVHSSQRTSTVIFGMLIKKRTDICVYAVTQYGRCEPPAAFVYEP